MGKPWKRRLLLRRLAALRASSDATVETTPVVLETIEAKTQKPITETAPEPPIKKPPTTKTVTPQPRAPKKKKSTRTRLSTRKKTTKPGTTTSGT